jgi:hypothetical protein
MRWDQVLTTNGFLPHEDMVTDQSEAAAADRPRAARLFVLRERRGYVLRDCGADR